MFPDVIIYIKFEYSSIQLDCSAILSSEKEKKRLLKNHSDENMRKRVLGNESEMQHEGARWREKRRKD